MALGRRDLLQAAQLFVADEDGTTAVEYALLASLLVVGIMSTVRLMGQSVEGLYELVYNAFP